MKRGETAVAKTCNIVARCRRGNSIVGYAIADGRGGVRLMSRTETMKLAESGVVANARFYWLKGVPSMTGVGCDLRKLPELDASAPELSKMLRLATRCEVG